VPKGYTQKRMIRDFEGEAREAAPTDALPGSPEKVDELVARANRKESLFSDRDTDQDERRGLVGKPTAGTGGVNRQTRPAGTVIEKDRPRKDRCKPESVRRLGGRIHHFRTSRGLSQGQLARKAKVDRNHLSCLERGLFFPSVPVLVALAEALGMTPDHLLGYRPAPTA
jgi:ribosome-binding protein aMBF1 (putative translation factor)